MHHARMQYSLGKPSKSWPPDIKSVALMTSGPSIADGSRSGPPDSCARYGAVRKQCQKITCLSRRYGFRSRTVGSLHPPPLAHEGNLCDRTVLIGCVSEGYVILHTKMKARAREIKNENWSDVRKEITSNHKIWAVAKVLKSDVCVAMPALKNSCVKPALPQY
ncbi:hypothetical protein EVAR_7623_1 [Eumeta japonica]|uniref:Uncharacterized protein n=1 Tax=Eumeta variegata TaxID=151549 RepID=A0A4C1TI69_EUMVA|nr:hypothetical protein EVAR_7623_1 [Eumeta japonica]